VCCFFLLLWVSIAGKLVYGSFLPLESFLYLSLSVACFFLLLCLFFLSFLFWGAVGGWS
jgi:hypothetical protein